MGKPDNSEDVEMFSVTQIRRMFDQHASNDDWGVPSFYEDGLIDSLRENYRNE